MTVNKKDAHEVHIVHSCLGGGGGHAYFEDGVGGLLLTRKFSLKKNHLFSEVPPFPDTFCYQEKELLCSFFLDYHHVIVIDTVQAVIPGDSLKL